MRIGFDARMYGPAVGGGGLGRYVEELLTAIAQQHSQHRFVLFLKKENFEHSSIPSSFTKVLANIHWYSLAEQLFLPWMIDRQKLDLIHFPHWNVPLFLRTPFIVTIHDLILLEQERSAKTTTRHPLIFALKRWAHRWLLPRVLNRARLIIAVSHTTQASILKHYPHIPPEKIVVIYEGVPKRFADLPNTPTQITRPLSLLYVGNFYPHKNLPFLVDAFALILQHDPTATLTLAGRQDMFQERLLAYIQTKPYASHIRIVPSPTDEGLNKLYKEAHLCIFPSLIEGFGLPPLEALAHGRACVVSSIPCFHEILENAVEYFDPTDSESLVYAIQSSLRNEVKHTQTLRTSHILSRYSWTRAATQTLETYSRF